MERSRASTTNAVSQVVLATAHTEPAVGLLDALRRRKHNAAHISSAIIYYYGRKNTVMVQLHGQDLENNNGTLLLILRHFLASAAELMKCGPSCHRVCITPD